MHESLGGEVGIIRLDETFALCAGADDDTRVPGRLCHFHGLPDGIDEGFRGEWLHDAGGPDNGNASFDTEAGIEGAFGYFFSTGDGDGNENRIGLFGNMEAFKP